MKLKSTILISGCLIGSLYCLGQNKSPYYSSSEEDWESTPTANLESITQTIYLIGDAGSDSIKSANVLSLVSNHLFRDAGKKTILFLGDNIYPTGMPLDTDKSRIKAESRISPQLHLASKSKSSFFFLPGNHDWEMGKKNGLEVLSQEEVYIESIFNDENVFIPDQGCPGPVEVEISDHLTLAAIDVQWWLHKYDKPLKNEICNSENENDFIQNLKWTINQNRGKTLLIAAHHPIHSNGNHGGYFSPKAHLFPLTTIKSNLYIPLPILGTLYVFGRRFFGSIQDLPNKKYKSFIKKTIGSFSSSSNIIYVAGHEHNLQYFNKNNYHHIISGSGSKTTWLSKNGGANFAYSQKGFSKLIATKDKELWVEFWIPSDANENGILVFKKKIISLE